jgi:CRISPR/Cas system-associated exonuclease Cas4 (RecB family)
MDDIIYGIPAVKTNSKEDDAHKDGAKCIVIAESVESHIGFIYLTIFEDFRFPVAVANTRIKLLSKENRVKVELTKAQKEYLEPFSKGLFKFYKDEKTQESNAKV